MNKSGLSLFEFLIYLTLLSLLTLLVLQWFSASVGSMRKNQTHANNMVQMYAAADVFVRDIMHASCDEATWLVKAPHELAWKKGDAIIRWQCEHDTLVRIEQKAHDAHGTKNLLARDIEGVFSSDDRGCCALRMYPKNDSAHALVIHASPRLGVHA